GTLDRHVDVECRHRLVRVQAAADFERRVPHDTADESKLGKCSVLPFLYVREIAQRDLKVLYGERLLGFYARRTEGGGSVPYFHDIEVEGEELAHLLGPVDAGAELCLLLRFALNEV